LNATGDVVLRLAAEAVRHRYQWQHSVGPVIEVIARLVSVHGAPPYLRPRLRQFVATAMLRWLQTAQIVTAFIDPGKPWQNGTDESFAGKLREECLTIEWFTTKSGRT